MNRRHKSKQSKKSKEILDSLNKVECLKDVESDNPILESKWFPIHDIPLNNSEFSEEIIQNTINWSQLPSSLDPSFGELNDVRAQRKRYQVEYLLRLVEIEIQYQLRHCQNITVIEFGSGSGHLSLLLAYRNPTVHFILVERKEYSINVTKERIAICQLSNISLYTEDIRDFEHYLYEYCINNNLQYMYIHPNRTPSAHMESKSDNILQEYSCMDDSSNKEHTIIGIGLHCCGLLTDYSIDFCLRHQASFVIVPCCYGQIYSPPPSSLPTDITTVINSHNDNTATPTIITISQDNTNNNNNSDNQKNDIFSCTVTSHIDECNTSSSFNSFNIEQFILSYRSHAIFKSYPTCLPCISSGADTIYKYDKENIPLTDDIIMNDTHFQLAKRCMNMIDYDRLLHVLEYSTSHIHVHVVPHVLHFHNTNISSLYDSKDNEVIIPQLPLQQPNDSDYKSDRNKKGRYICRMDTLRPLSCSPKNNIIIGRYIHVHVSVPVDDNNCEVT